MFSPFQEFGKSTADLVEEDFPTEVSLAITSTGPNKVGITTTQALCKKGGGLVPALAVSWTRDWLNLEKLEIGADGHINLDASVGNVYPGLDVSFRGNSIDKSDLLMTYKCVMPRLISCMRNFSSSSCLHPVNPQLLLSDHSLHLSASLLATCLPLIVSGHSRHLSASLCISLHLCVFPPLLALSVLSRSSSHLITPKRNFQETN